MSPVVNVKVAYGYRSLCIVTNINHTLTRFVQTVQQEIRQNFDVRDATRIEIVLNRGLPYSELGLKIPETATRVNDYVREELGEQEDWFKCHFYARIIVLVGNDKEYIKVFGDSIQYIKKEELEEVRNGTREEARRLSEIDMSRLPVVLTTPEVCSICQEQNVNDVCLYACSHVFCNQCTSRWRLNCALCRQHAL